MAGQLKMDQLDSWMRVDTPLGKDKVVLEELSGHEAVSQPFSFSLQVLSNDHAIKPTDLLRKSVTVTAQLQGGGERYFNGSVNRFQFVGIDHEYDLATYSFDIVPWLWYLSLTTDCRVFQNMSARDIIKEIFKKYDGADYKFSCQSGPTREYCVQYRESDLNFVSRLMEEEGIFYYFEHTDGAHKLILSDDSSGLSPCPKQAKFQVASDWRGNFDEVFIKTFHWEHTVDVERITLRDYDYLNASTGLESTAPQGASNQGGSALGGEFYDYPGGYRELRDGDRYAKLRFEERISGLYRAHGEGNATAMTPGYTFELENHPIESANSRYMLTGVTHEGGVAGYHSSRGREHYSSSFECTRSDVVYRPRHTAYKPVVRGSQTAVVVGPGKPEDEVIFTDDAGHGRVKIQFPWDRIGKKNEKSSCWVRVVTPWAGKGWGAVSLPRIGHEVVVDFIEGDPDRPLITGGVYNSDNHTPYALPADKTQSGILSRSSEKGGAANFNEIRMEDKKDSELLYLHAEKDKQVIVENDRTESVGHDESVTIGNDRTEEVGHDETITIMEDQKITVEGNRTESVGKDEQTSIKGKRTESVGKEEEIDIGDEQDVSIGKDQTISVGRSRSIDVKDDDELKVGKTIKIEAGDEILLKTGKASLLMKKDGTITIKGKDITLKGSGKINVEASAAVTIKGSQIKQN